MTVVFVDYHSLRVGFIADRNVAPESHSGGKEAMIDAICGGGGSGANGSDSDAASIIMAAITAVSVGPRAPPN